MPNPNIDKIKDIDAGEEYAINDTWRPIYIKDEDMENEPLHLIQGRNIILSYLGPELDHGDVTIHAIDTKPTDYETNETAPAVSMPTGGNWQLVTNDPILYAEENELWLIIVALEYQSNATGIRGVGISDDPGTAPPIIYKNQVNAVNGAVTNLTFATFIKPTQSSNFYIWGRQDSGQNLNVTYRTRVVRLL